MEYLLKPRIKVIADFWNNPFQVGEVIQFEKYGDYHDFLTDKVLGQDWSTNLYELKKPFHKYPAGTSIVWNLRGFKPYPHLFQLLNWWEGRTEDQMPRYLKHGPDGKTRKVEEYFLRVNCIIFEGGRQRNFTPEGNGSKWLPSTEEEYKKWSNKPINK